MTAQSLRAYAGELLPPRFHLDRTSFVLAGLMLAIGAVAVHLAGSTPPVESQPFGRSESDPAAGAMVVGVLVIEGLLLLGLYYLTSRIPGWVKKAVLWGGFSLLALYVAVRLALVSVLGATVWLASLVLVYAVSLAILRLLARGGVFWILFDGLAFVGAVGASVLVGLMLGPLPMLVLITILIFLDHVETDLTGYMDWLARLAIDWRLPVLFVIPRSLRFDMSELEGTLDGEDVGASIVGVGDFAIPAALAASVAHRSPGSLEAMGVVFGAAVGMLVLRHALKDAEGSRAALPYVAPPAIGGLLVGAAITALFGLVLGGVAA